MKPWTRSIGNVAKVGIITFIILISALVGSFVAFNQNSTSSSSASSVNTTTSSQSQTSESTSQRGALAPPSDSSSGYIAKATFYSEGNYYAFYSNENSTIGKFSQDGISWKNVSSTFSLPRDSILYWYGNLLYVVYFENSTLYLTNGTPIANGINWSKTNEFSVYTASDNSSIVPVSLKVDASGSIWIAYTTSDGSNSSLNYFVAKIDVNSNSFAVAKGFPYFIGTAPAESYNENSLNIATLSDGETVVVACGVGPNSSSYLREWTEGNWSNPLDFEYPCGYNPNSLFEGEAVGSIISILSVNNSIELLYYAAQARCDACSYTNSSVLVITYTNSSFSVSRLIYNANGAYIGTSSGTIFLFANSALSGQYNGSLSKNVYYSSARGLAGDLFTTDGSGLASSIVSSNYSSSGAIVLYSIQMTNGSSINFKKSTTNAVHNSPNPVSLKQETILPVFPLIPIPIDPLFAANTAWYFTQNTMWEINISALANNDSAFVVRGYENVFPANVSAHQVGASYIYESSNSQFFYNASTMLLCQAYFNGTTIAFFNLENQKLSILNNIQGANKFACPVSTDGKGILYSMGPNGSLEEYNIQNSSVADYTIPVNVQMGGSGLLIDNTTNPTTIYYEVGNLTPSLSYGIVKMNSDGSGFRFFQLPHTTNFVLMDQQKNIWVSSGLGNTTLMELNTSSGRITSLQVGMSVYGAILTPKGLWTIDIGRSPPTVIAFFSFKSYNLTESINLTGNRFIDVMTPAKGYVDTSGRLWFYLWYGTLGCGGSEPCDGIAAYFIRIIPS